MDNIHPIRAYRGKHKLSQAELAKNLGVSRLTILRWERGERKIDPSLVPTVARATGIPAKKLRPDLVERMQKIFGGAA